MMLHVSIDDRICILDSERSDCIPSPIDFTMDIMMLYACYVFFFFLLFILKFSDGKNVPNLRTQFSYVVVNQKRKTVYT